MGLTAQEIGKRIQEIRKEKGLTQTELGAKIGKSESTIRKYESGSVEPSFKVLNDMSEELKIDVSYFLRVSENQLTEHERQLLKQYELEVIQRLDYEFSNIKDLIGYLVETDMFKKEFKIEYDKLSDSKKKNLINDIYKSIEYNCFKIE